MSFGSSGGGGDNSMMLTMLMQDRDRANAEAARIKAQNDAKAAEAETKRVNRTRAGGMQAFATNGYMGYSDRVLGGGSSVSVTA